MLYHSAFGLDFCIHRVNIERTLAMALPYDDSTINIVVVIIIIIIIIIYIPENFANFESNVLDSTKV